MKTELQRNGLILYASHWPAISDLSTYEKGKVLEAVFEFHLHGTMPEFENQATRIVFKFIQMQMEIDRKKYQDMAMRNKDNAHRRWIEKEACGKSGIDMDASASSRINEDANNNSRINESTKNANKRKNKSKSKNNNKNLDNDNCVESFVERFNKIRGSKFRVPDKVRRQFNARLQEGYSADDMLRALQNAMRAENHINSNFKYLTPEFFTRADKIELYTESLTASTSTNTVIFSDQQTITLGPGEWMDGGKRFYGNRDNPYPVPLNASPRPGKNHFFDYDRGAWNS